MDDFFKMIAESYAQKENLVLATILEKSGSAPCSGGTKMLIRPDLTTFGTIGGGLIEAMVIQTAARVYKNHADHIESFDLKSKDKKSQGLICGGTLKIIFEYIDWWKNQNQSFYEEIFRLQEAKQDFITITRINHHLNNISLPEKWVCTETGFYGPESEASQNLVEEVCTNFEQYKYRAAFLEPSGFYVEPFFCNENVVIIGCGKIGGILAELSKLVGFYVTMVDDREEFANWSRFKKVDHVLVVPGLKNIENNVIINQYSFVVIVTRGHSDDKEVLAQMLETDAKYIGMIGSHNKCNYIYQSLLNQGFNINDWERVHCPIGINISADTPEEIAVSIVAEMIEIRRSQE